MMAIVHSGKGKLPDARALLYAECVDLLLLRWRQAPGQADVLSQLELPPFRSNDLFAIMAQLGFIAHEQALRNAQSRDLPADLSRGQIQHVLDEVFAPYTPGDPIRRERLVSTVLHAIAIRNGLLLKRSSEQGESYAFPHRTFQEFLAGYHIKSRRDYLKVCKERAEHAHWREALSLMVGYQVLKDDEIEKPLLLVRELLVRSPTEQALAGEMLNLIGRERALRHDAALTDALWQRAHAALLQIITAGRAPDAPAALRVSAGFVLGELCYGSLEELTQLGLPPVMPDPRLPLTVLGLPMQQEPWWQGALRTYWCAIAPGLFWYGDDREEQLQRVELAYAYQIARYPVTNADFARFVAAGGYDDQRW